MLRFPGLLRKACGLRQRIKRESRMVGNNLTCGHRDWRYFLAANADVAAASPRNERCPDEKHAGLASGRSSDRKEVGGGQPASCAKGGRRCRSQLARRAIVLGQEYRRSRARGKTRAGKRTLRRDGEGTKWLSEVAPEIVAQADRTRVSHRSRATGPSAVTGVGTRSLNEGREGSRRRDQTAGGVVVAPEKLVEVAGIVQGQKGPR